MIDTHAITLRLTGSGLSTEEADEHRDHVAPEALRPELASLEARLPWRFAGAMLAQTLAMLRLLE